MRDQQTGAHQAWTSHQHWQQWQQQQHLNTTAAAMHSLRSDQYHRQICYSHNRSSSSSS
jgi:hypothetical protein